MIPASCAWGRIGLRRSLPSRCDLEILRGTTRPHRPTDISRVTRRWNSAPRPVGQEAPSSTKTIPGPTWLWLEPIYGPFRAYGRIQQRRPYMTQFVSALVIYFVGDMVAQSMGPPPAKDGVEEDGEEERGWVQAWAEDRDWARTARALFIGGAAAVPGYRWFLWLGNSFNFGSKVLSLTTKVAVNQMVFTPLFNSYFFGMHSLLSGASISETLTRIRNTVPTSWINSCKLWPAVTAFMFVYVPIQYRSIFGGIIAIGWQTYLSLLNQRAAAKEEAETIEDQAHNRPSHVPSSVDAARHEGRGEKCTA